MSGKSFPSSLHARQKALFQISSIFVIPYLAFLVILPGVREKRIVTLAVFTVVTLVGAVLAGGVLSYTSFYYLSKYFNLQLQWPFPVGREAPPTSSLNLGLTSMNEWGRASVWTLAWRASTSHFDVRSFWMRKACWTLHWHWILKDVLQSKKW